MKSLFLILLLTALPAQAGLESAFGALISMCLGPYRFQSDDEATRWLFDRINQMNLSREERYMLEQWPAGGVSRGINSKLRVKMEVDRDKVIASEPYLITNGHMLDLFARLHERNKITRSIIAFRGVGADDIGEVKKGQVVPDLGLGNYSLRSDVPHRWGRYNSEHHPSVRSPYRYTILEVQFPVGTPYTPVGRIHHVFGVLEAGELSIVPKKEFKFRVTDWSVDSSGVRTIKGVGIP